MINPSLTASKLARRTFLAGLGTGTLTGVPFVPAQALSVVKGTVVGKDGWLFLVWDDPRRANPQRMLEVTQFISKTVGLLRSAQVETVIALTPAKARVYSEFLPDDFSFSADATQRYSQAREKLRGSGALVPDLAAAFAGLRTTHPDENIFFKTDTHWTAWASEFAATEVAKQMKEKFHLPPSGRPGTQIGGSVTQTHRNNDLSAALAPEARKEYPAELYQIRPPMAAQGRAALIEDEEADIVVVGNSYMQPMYNFAPMLSNQLDRPTSLIWKVHLVGPYKTMLSYLGGESFRRQRPKVIIWNFHEIDMEIMPDNQAAWPQDAISTEAFLSDVGRMLRS